MRIFHRRICYPSVLTSSSSIVREKEIMNFMVMAVNFRKDTKGCIVVTTVVSGRVHKSSARELLSTS